MLKEGPSEKRIVLPRFNDFVPVKNMTGVIALERGDLYQTGGVT